MFDLVSPGGKTILQILTKESTNKHSVFVFRSLQTFEVITPNSITALEHDQKRSKDLKAPVRTLISVHPFSLRAQVHFSTQGAEALKAMLLWSEQDDEESKATGWTLLHWAALASDPQVPQLRDPFSTAGGSNTSQNCFRRSTL